MKTERHLVAATPYLDLVEVDYQHEGKMGKWFGVTRTNAKTAVVIAAVTTEDELIFVSQPRPMLSAITIELPAGLSDKEGESAIETARRELLEETGYSARDFKVLLGGQKGLSVSSGLTDERLILVLATGATKACEPLTNEQTEPILVPLNQAFAWAKEMARKTETDYKLLGTILLVQKEVQR